jgi:hypothetical protein
VRHRREVRARRLKRRAGRLLSMSKLGWLAAVIFVLFGILSVHYTIGQGIEHHTEWADRHGMPRPSFPIFVIGIVAIMLGSAAGGWLLGRRGRV